jgi:hypothetical protein
MANRDWNNQSQFAIKPVRYITFISSHRSVLLEDKELFRKDQRNVEQKGWSDGNLLRNKRENAQKKLEIPPTLS